MRIASSTMPSDTFIIAVAPAAAADGPSRPVGGDRIGLHDVVKLGLGQQARIHADSVPAASVNR